jgi:hypothetical protein
MLNFYENKAPTLPRFFYRNFLAHIKSHKIKNNDAIELFKEFILNTKGADFLKFTWNIPAQFQEIFNKEELNRLNEILEIKRNKKPAKLKRHVFPHVSDEFSLSNTFLNSIFDKEHLPLISKNDIFFTMGSCFARNFSTYLKFKGIDSENLGQAEDLNTPGSNSLLLEYASIKNEKRLKDKLSKLVDIYWIDLPKDKRGIILEKKITEILSIKKTLGLSTKIIITLGNTVDFYRLANNRDELVPKFIALNHSEDVNERNDAAARIKKAGAFIRLSKFDEVKNYILDIYKAIRSISSNSTIIFTISPVPIDSVLGINEPLGLSAIEIDCISKSTIRSALYEATISEELMKDKNIFYLPSYEIVRWVAPLVGIPIFGKEDAASRHVSNEVLNSICNFIYSNNNIEKQASLNSFKFNYTYKL